MEAPVYASFPSHQSALHCVLPGYEYCMTLHLVQYWAVALVARPHTPPLVWPCCVAAGHSGQEAKGAGRASREWFQAGRGETGMAKQEGGDEV